jgi:hypothetical protein
MRTRFHNPTGEKQMATQRELMKENDALRNEIGEVCTERDELKRKLNALREPIIEAYEQLDEDPEDVEGDDNEDDDEGDDANDADEDGDDDEGE